jgi:hypothetical protein
MIVMSAKINKRFETMVADAEDLETKFNAGIEPRELWKLTARLTLSIVCYLIVKAAE